MAPVTPFMTCRVELATGEFVFFISQGETEKDHHFVTLLKDAWQRIPATARAEILDYHLKKNKCEAKIRLIPRPNDNFPIAMAGPEGFLISCDSLRILDLPGKDAWAILCWAKN